MDMSGKPDRGVMDATARGVAQGFTANFGDEIRGLVEASGANPDDPASLMKAAVRRPQILVRGCRGQEALRRGDQARTGIEQDG
jgi:hypothetical protein